MTTRTGRWIRAADRPSDLRLPLIVDAMSASEAFFLEGPEGEPAVDGRLFGGPGGGRSAAARYSTTASASISTSISGSINRDTSTIAVVGLMPANTSPCARPIASQSRTMLVT